MGVAGWLDQVGIKLFQLSTKLKLKLSLAIYCIITVNVWPLAVHYSGRNCVSLFTLRNLQTTNKLQNSAKYCTHFQILRNSDYHSVILCVYHKFLILYNWASGEQQKLSHYQ